MDTTMDKVHVHKRGNPCIPGGKYPLIPVSYLGRYETGQMLL